MNPKILAKCPYCDEEFLVNINQNGNVSYIKCVNETCPESFAIKYELRPTVYVSKIIYEWNVIS